MSRKKTFDERVKRTRSCHVWIGANNGGYGEMRHPETRKLVKAHRYAWSLVNGPILTGLVLHHTCHNKLCVRVSHLQLMTKSEHVKLHRLICKQGHVIADPNVYYTTYSTTGRVLRRCKICHLDRVHAYRKAKRDGKQAVLVSA